MHEGNLQHVNFSSNTQQIYSTTELSDVVDPSEQIQIIAQPEKEYHPRYRTDFNKEKRRALRYIRSDEKSMEYPTIKIPSIYCNANLKLYIRVCLITVPNSKTSIQYIHPYSLDTPELPVDGVIRNSIDNAIYFKITQADIDSAGVKRFIRLMLVKSKQDILKLYGPLRAFRNLNENHALIENNQTCIQNAKEMIKYYDLSKSQLVFTICQQQNDDSSKFYSFPETSAYSEIMTEESEQDIQRKRAAKDEHVICRVHKYAPKMGGCLGNDVILLFLTTRIDKNNLQIHFETSEWLAQVNNEDIDIEDRMISFKSPSYLNQNLNVPVSTEIILAQNQIVFQRLQFYYMPQNVLYANIYCKNCQISEAKYNSLLFSKLLSPSDLSPKRTFMSFVAGQLKDGELNQVPSESIESHSTVVCDMSLVVL
ncbi:unnamed protein product [Didymodactylos carnosus]|uniref:RHD domain-containing protein n=1 Tax=Didymodactylos carnosus TaxID=1234261 RepID=A0A814QP42_9BILA|nr:unnamed protein product [Didymodactylos carnosus]CAF3885915.1 unnamed protein product [Didymodactylos carnosus]